MADIKWNEVNDGVLDSLKPVILSGSTSRRRAGLHELHEKILCTSTPANWRD